MSSELLPKATPQNSHLDDTLPATESQIAKSLHGSPEATGDLEPSPTSPGSSLPSSASKTEDEVIWSKL